MGVENDIHIVVKGIVNDLVDTFYPLIGDRVPVLSVHFLTPCRGNPYDIEACCRDGIYHFMRSLRVAPRCLSAECVKCVAEVPAGLHLTHKLVYIYITHFSVIYLFHGSRFLCSISCFRCCFRACCIDGLRIITAAAYHQRHGQYKRSHCFYLLHIAVLLCIPLFEVYHISVFIAMINNPI